MENLATQTNRVLIDLMELAGGKVEMASFPDKIRRVDFSVYKGKQVQLSGCAPTWAHLLVAAKLFPYVSGLSFKLDDGREGKSIPIW